nr:metallophosphoesterase [uncultured Ruminococcus sp.]
MIFVTGDCHGEFQKLSTAAFPEQREMTKDDIVIICGDFGAIWDCDGVSNAEKYWLNWLDEKPFTTVFVDGNHENFDRLNSEFEVVDFHGGKAHKLNDSVYHLMRGEIFDFEGKKEKSLILKERNSLPLAERDRTISTTVFSRGRILTRRRNSRKPSANGENNGRFSESTISLGGLKSCLLTRKSKTRKTILQRLIIR